MKYTTPVRVCHEGEHEIDDAPAIDNKGYKGREPEKEVRADSEGKANTVLTYHRLCRSHYLEDFAAAYPNEALPAI